MRYVHLEHYNGRIRLSADGGILVIEAASEGEKPPMLGLEFRGNELTFPKAGFDANTAEPVDLLESWLNSGAQAEL